MALTIKCRVKDKGDITWPPVGEPDWPDDADEAREKRREWLRERITEAAEDTRAALGVSTFKTVHVSLSFKPDIMVDP